MQILTQKVLFKSRLLRLLITFKGSFFLSQVAIDNFQRMKSRAWDIQISQCSSTTGLHLLVGPGLASLWGRRNLSLKELGGTDEEKSSPEDTKVPSKWSLVVFSQVTRVPFLPITSLFLSRDGKQGGLTANNSDISTLGHLPCLPRDRAWLKNPLPTGADWVTGPGFGAKRQGNHWREKTRWRGNLDVQGKKCSFQTLLGKLRHRWWNS